MSNEPLDIEQHDQLLAYLRATSRIGPAESPQLKTLAGGVSNRTVWLKRESGEAWVVKQALEKLRVKVDWFSDPSRIHREALGLKWLEKLAPPGTITPLVFEDAQHHLLAMQAVPEPHENWKTMLLAGRVDMKHVDQFAKILGTIQRRASGTPEVATVFDDRSFFESLRIEPYYAYTASQVPEASDFLADLIDDTRRRRFTLVHGDYSPKNILVRDGKLVLLDHEVIHWGDGAFDVGFALAHLLSKAHYLKSGKSFAKAAINFFVNYDMFRGVTDGDSENERMVIRHTLGCLLARVAGRSPLEYLDEPKRDRQRQVVTELMKSPPRELWRLVSDFLFNCGAFDAD
jgi:5-methylthioribose kinase